jgi:Flp pilus assembly protein TadD
MNTSPANDGFKNALVALLGGEKSPAETLGIPARVLDGMYALGRDALTRNRITDAESLFTRCVQLDARQSHFWSGLASVRRAQGRLEEAGELFQFSAMFARDASPMAYAAACYAEAGQFERARVLAEHVRSTVSDVSGLEPWLSVAERAQQATPLRSKP